MNEDLNKDKFGKDFRKNKNIVKVKQAKEKATGFLKSLSPFMIGGILVGTGLGIMIHKALGGFLFGIGVGYILEQIFLDNDPSE